MIPVSEHDIFTKIVRVAPNSSVVILKKKEPLSLSSSILIWNIITLFFHIVKNIS